MSEALQTYVDQQLMSTGKVDRAAILDQDGNTLAQSAGFRISPADGRSLHEQFVDPSLAMKNGIYVGGNQYAVVQADHRAIYGKRRLGGIVVVKTAKCIVVAIHEEGQAQGNAAAVVHCLADMLIEAGW